MGLSGAERQRRYLARLKQLAAVRPADGEIERLHAEIARLGAERAELFADKLHLTAAMKRAAPLPDADAAVQRLKKQNAELRAELRAAKEHYRGEVDTVLKAVAMPAAMDRLIQKVLHVDRASARPPPTDDERLAAFVAYTEWKKARARVRRP